MEEIYLWTANSHNLRRQQLCLAFKYSPLTFRIIKSIVVYTSWSMQHKSLVYTRLQILKGNKTHWNESRQLIIHSVHLYLASDPLFRLPKSFIYCQLQCFCKWKRLSPHFTCPWRPDVACIVVDTCSHFPCKSPLHQWVVSAWNTLSGFLTLYASLESYEVSSNVIAVGISAVCVQYIWRWINATTLQDLSQAPPAD